VDRGRRAAQHGADEEAPAVGRPHRMADFLHLAEQWQTLIAGLLGLAGGGNRVSGRKTCRQSTGGGGRESDRGVAGRARRGGRA
jgi:hypothetical protein